MTREKTNPYEGDGVYQSQIRKRVRGKDIDWDHGMIRRMAGLRISQRQAALIMGVALSSFEKALKNNESIRVAWDEGKAQSVECISGEMFRRAMGSKKEPGCNTLLAKLYTIHCHQEVKKVEVEAPGMSGEKRRAAMAELMGEDPEDPDSGMEDDGSED